MNFTYRFLLVADINCHIRLKNIPPQEEGGFRGVQYQNPIFKLPKISLSGPGW